VEPAGNDDDERWCASRSLITIKRAPFVAGSAVLAAIALLPAQGCGGTSTPPAPTCSFTLGQVATTIDAAGASGSIPVTTAATCTWTAVSLASFISITQGASGAGNGVVQFVVAANTGAERTGTLTIAGGSVTLTQRAFVAPTLAAPMLASPAAGDTVGSLRPTLVVTNAAATGAIGTVTYRFEVSEGDDFPNSAKTVAQGGVAQGSGATTSWQVTSDLLPNFLYFWRVRATNGTITSDWSTILTFKTPR
jgi:hypothetical protein